MGSRLAPGAKNLYNLVLVSVPCARKSLRIAVVVTKCSFAAIQIHLTFFFVLHFLLLQNLLFVICISCGNKHVHFVK